VDRHEAVRKAAALLRLAARPGTAGEAAAAAAKAQDMLDRWNLTEAAVTLAGHDEQQPEAPRDYYDVPEGWLDSTPRAIPWRSILCRALCALHGCYYFQAWRGKGSSLEIVGPPAGVESVRYVYAWLVREVDRLTDQHGAGLGRVWRREFAEGAAHEIGRRLKEQRAETAREVRAEYVANPCALVRVDSALARIGQDAEASRMLATRVHNLRTRAGSSNRQHNGTAREAGRQAGARVNLKPSRGSLPGSQGALGF